MWERSRTIFDQSEYANLFGVNLPCGFEAIKASRVSPNLHLQMKPSLTLMTISLIAWSSNAWYLRRRPLFDLIDPFEDLMAPFDFPRPVKNTYTKIDTSVNPAIVQIDAPGFKPSEVEISLGEDGSLFVKGEHKCEKGQEGACIERRFERQMLLPRDLDGGSSTAKLEDGVLSIHIPHSPKPERKTIPVLSAGEPLKIQK